MQAEDLLDSVDIDIYEMTSAIFGECSDELTEKCYTLVQDLMDGIDESYITDEHAMVISYSTTLTDKIADGKWKATIADIPLEEAHTILPLDETNPFYEVVTKTASTIAGAAVREIGMEIVEHMQWNAEEKAFSVNSRNMPSLSEAENMIAKAMALNCASELMASESSWLVGNLISELRKIFGDNLDLSKVAGVTNKSYNLIVTSEKVFDRFRGCRIPGLTFTHHKEVMFQKHLEDEWREPILIAAKRNNLTCKDTRNLCNRFKGEPGEDARDITDDEVKDFLLRNEPDNKKTYILIEKEGERKRFTGAISDTMLERYDFILMIHPEIKVMKGTMSSEEES